MTKCVSNVDMHGNMRVNRFGLTRATSNVALYAARSCLKPSWVAIELPLALDQCFSICCPSSLQALRHSRKGRVSAEMSVSLMVSECRVVANSSSSFLNSSRPIALTYSMVFKRPVNVCQAPIARFCKSAGRLTDSVILSITLQRYVV